MREIFQSTNKYSLKLDKSGSFKQFPVHFAIPKNNGFREFAEDYPPS